MTARSVATYAALFGSSAGLSACGVVAFTGSATGLVPPPRVYAIAGGTAFLLIAASTVGLVLIDKVGEVRDRVRARRALRKAIKAAPGLGNVLLVPDFSRFPAPPQEMPDRRPDGGVR